MFTYTIGESRTWREDYNKFRFGISRQEESLLLIRLFRSYNRIMSFNKFREYFTGLMREIDFTEALTIRDEEGNIKGKQRIIDCVKEGYGEHVQEPDRDSKLYKTVAEKIVSLERYIEFVNKDKDILDNIDKLKNEIRENTKDITEEDIDKRVFEYILDECFMNYCVGMMMSHISKLNEMIVASNIGIIDWVFDNLDENKYKECFKSKNLNMSKIRRYSDEIIFTPTYKSTCNFFLSENDACPHPVFDVENLMNRLISNIILKTDIYIITAIYGIIFSAAIDFENNNPTSKAAVYVSDIISKL